MPRHPPIDRRLTDAESDLVARNAALLSLVVRNPKLARLAEALGDEAEAKGVAAFGLMRAAQLYDPARGRFSTFAVKCMWSYLCRAVTAKYRGRRRLPEGRSLRALDESRDRVRPDGGFEQIDRADFWEAVRRVLTPRARRVLERRAEGATLAEVGAEVGVCRERVRQIEDRAVARLRARAGVD